MTRELFTGVWRDLVLAARSLAKARAFTFVCVVSLGIGMAPAIAIQYGSRIFTTAPPVVATDGLVEIVTTRVGAHEPTPVWAYADFIDLGGAATGVTMAGWAVGQRHVVLPASGGAKTAVQAMFVSSNYFQTIGVALARGSGFGDRAEPVVILSHQFWQTRLAADPAVVGTALDIDGVAHVVAGIGPEKFGGHLSVQDADVFLPLEQHPGLVADRQARFDRGQAWVRIHGRLSPGVSVAQASAAVAAITAQLAKEHPATNEFRAGIVEPYYPTGAIDRAEVTVILRVFQAASALPLFIVCLNVSGMMQVRSAMRERDLSIRRAIGASRGRLMRHLLAEALVLATLGGTLASLVLFNLASAIAWWSGEPLPPQMEAALRVDARMLLVCAGLCLVTSLVFGLLPALRFSRPAIMTVLKDESGSGGIRAGRAHRITSALQVAIAVPPLILGAVSLERVRATATSDLGFAAEELYAAPLEIDAATGGDVASTIRRVRDTLAATTGVASVTVADGLPLDFRYRLATVSAPATSDAAPVSIRAHVTRIGDGYLDTLGIPLVRGRGFTSEDVAGAPLVTVISRSLADRLFPEGGAIGQSLDLAARDADDRPPQPLTIIGITADFPTSQMSTDREQLLVPLAQHPDIRRDAVPVDDDRGGGPHVMIVARSAPGEAAAKMTAALENAMRDVDPDFDRASIVTGAWLRRFSMDDFLTQSAVGGISGGVVLLLAALGIYGVVGMMVTTRTREIAMRVTLGASRSRIMGMILFDVIRLIAPGVVVGVIATVGLVRLNGVTLSAAEPLAYVVGSTIAVLTAVLAALLPARRAASVHPMVAMRST